MSGIEEMPTWLISSLVSGLVTVILVVPYFIGYRNGLKMADFIMETLKDE